MSIHNSVDFTGFVFRPTVKCKSESNRLYFTLNIPKRYKSKDSGQYKTRYDKIACVVYDNSEKARINYFMGIIQEGDCIRIKGELNGWTEGLITDKFERFDYDKKDEYLISVTKNSITISEFEKIEKKRSNSED